MKLTARDRKFFVNHVTHAVYEAEQASQTMFATIGLSATPAMIAPIKQMEISIDAAWRGLDKLAQVRGWAAVIRVAQRTVKAARKSIQAAQLVQALMPPKKPRRRCKEKLDTNSRSW